MASRTEEQILSINEAAVPKTTKMATMFGLTVFHGKLFVHVTFCTLFVVFICYSIDRNTLNLDRLIIQLVRYILKQ